MKILALAKNIEFQIGLAFALLIILVTAVGYEKTVSSLREQAIENLRRSARGRAISESYSFVEAQRNAQALRTEYLSRLEKAGSTDPKAEFDKWFVRYPDGVIRVRRELDDNKHRPTVYIRPQIPLSAELRRQVVTAFELLREWGPALTLHYYSAYIDLPGQSLIMFSPNVNWGKEADATTNNFDYPPVRNSSPANNPRRKTMWTEVYFDDKASKWMLSVISPMDQVRWVGTASQDIIVDDLLGRNTRSVNPGTYNIMMDREGRLVAHPKMMEKIRLSQGKLDVKSIGDKELSDIYELARNVGDEPIVKQTRSGFAYLGISRIQGPDWIHIIVFPSSLVEQAGMQAAQSVLFIGAFGFIIVVLLSGWLLRQRETQQKQRTDQLEREVQRRIKIEENLARSEAFKDSLLQTIPDEVFVKDAQGRYVDVNRTYEQMYDLKRQDVVGKTNFDIEDTLDEAQWYEEKDRLSLESGKIVRYENWEYHAGKGHKVLIETVKTPIWGVDGKIIGILGVGRDITERYRSQKAMGQVVASIAHELNTPIGNALMIGSTLGDHARSLREKLQTGELTRPELQNHIAASISASEILERALQRASQLIGSFKQVSVDQVSEIRREFNLADSIEEILQTLRPSLRGTHISLIAAVPPDILMDSFPGLLVNVISNLVMNARMHAFEERDKGHIWVEAEEQAREVIIRVRDDGLGIPGEYRSRIFDPFFTTRQGRGGTGMGLSIVEALVSRGLGGNIKIDPNILTGATFVITLPKHAPQVKTSSSFTPFI